MLRLMVLQSNVYLQICNMFIHATVDVTDVIDVKRPQYG